MAVYKIETFSPGNSFLYSDTAGDPDISAVDPAAVTGDIVFSPSHATTKVWVARSTTAVVPLIAGGALLNTVPTQTAAGTFSAGFSGAINSATNAFYGIYSLVAAVTTARTGGVVAAFTAGLTGFATDTVGATYAAFQGLAPTANGGSAVFSLLKQAAGYARTLDLTAVATGEGVIALGDNLASALAIKEATTAYLTYVTTNGAELIVTGVPLKLGSTLLSIPTTLQDIAGAGVTIALPTTGTTKRVTAVGGAGTGTILAAGVDGQIVMLFNIGATNSITFAASGTSHVALGVACIIPALSAKQFVYDGVSSLWYSFGPS